MSTASQPFSPNNAELARRLRERTGKAITRFAVWKWFRPGGRIPAEWVGAVEAETGIPSWQLRPDIFPEEKYGEKSKA